MTSRPAVSRRMLLLAALAVVGGVSCMATQVAVSDVVPPVPGFFKGFWHGVIAPVSFVVSLFSDHIRVYAVPNAGRWYDFGFMLGIGGFTHGVWAGNDRNRRRKHRRATDAGIV